jgi:hypothetical protein
MKKQLESFLVGGSVLFLFTIVGGVCLVFADTNGPGAPAAPVCSEWLGDTGPCTDPRSYSGSGVGNGSCGRCGNVTYTYKGGACLGTYPTSVRNCAMCVTDLDVTRIYSSTPVGTLMFLACYTAASTCYVADAGIAMACGPACYVAGTLTLGTSCLACLAAAGGVGAACGCVYSECVETCAYTGTSKTGSVLACQISSVCIPISKP